LNEVHARMLVLVLHMNRDSRRSFSPFVSLSLSLSLLR
jgi:hypothetical protein